MIERTVYWGAVLCAALGLLLFGVSAALTSSNRVMQEEVNARQAVINNAVTTSPLNQSLAQALAEASVKDNDTAIRALLAEQGISVRKPEMPTKPDATAKKN